MVGVSDGPLVDFEAPWLAWHSALPRGGCRKVRVASPCVGVDSPCRAAMALKFPWVSVLIYDIEAELVPALDRMHGPVGTPWIRAGPRKGDVTQLTEKLLLDHLAQHGFRVCDGLVSGFPCPPYSSIGSRKLGDDPRAAVCTAVVNMIKWLAKRSFLQWFVLENVVGIKKRARGQVESFADWLMSFIMAELEREGLKGWRCAMRPHSAADTSLVQHRDRVFFVGTSSHMRETTVQRALGSMPLPVRPRVNLLSILEHRSSEIDFANLTFQQQLNVMTQMKRFDEMEAADPNFAHEMGVVDASRNADKEHCVDGDIKLDKVSTFRTNNKFLWLIPHRLLRHTFGPYGRLMSREEKCAASGLLASSLTGLSDHRLEVAIGNTIPPPLIGDILAPLLASWTLHMRDMQDRSFIHT